MNRKLCGKSIVFILYDSVSNSVFYSQVAMPLKKLLQEHKDSTLTIISFEKKNVSRELVQKIENQIDPHRCKLIIRKKISLISKISLWPCVFSLFRLLKRIPVSDIIARGPFAGWIALKSLRALPKKNIFLIVQARGLAAEEFRYTNKDRFAKTCFAKKYFYNLYKNIEHEVYEKKNINSSLKFVVETVSSALKEYLIDHFDADESQVAVSYYDIPDAIDKSQVKKWRERVRVELGISPDAYVYCYLGSAHPWQCVDHMVSYAAEKCKSDEKAFFLFLSGEKEVFERKLQEAHISRDRYVIRRIDPAETFRYLSAADAGLLFREKDPVNWVSRPTKMLEYKSVGLKLIHNNTVAWLTMVIK